MTTKVTTNNRVRELRSLAEIPEAARTDFDYITGDAQYEPRLFRFRDEWWDSHEFEVSPDELRRLGWDGQQTQSYWDAIVLRYFDRDGYELDGVIVGHATW